MDHTAALLSVPDLVPLASRAGAEVLVNQVLRACEVAGLAPDLEVAIAMWAAVVDADSDGPSAPLLRSVLDAVGGAGPAPGEAVLELLDALELLAEVEGCAWGAQAAA